MQRALLLFIFLGVYVLLPIDSQGTNNETEVTTLTTKASTSTLSTTTVRNITTISNVTLPTTKTTVPPSTSSTVENSTLSGTTDVSTELPPCIPTVNGTCHLNGTEEICDPCLSFACDSSMECSLSEECQPFCKCSNNTQHLVNETCISVCLSPNPCNTGVCQEDATSSNGYSCTCDKDFEGGSCEIVHNYCMDPSPSLCPSGPFNCQMNRPGNYSCQCATGYYHNVTDNSCLKVGQLINISLVFKNSFYHELYNDFNSVWFANASQEINETLSAVYQSLLIGIEYGTFSQGSLVSNLSIQLRVPYTGYPEDNVLTLKKYIVNCESRAWKNDITKLCFGSLGNAFVPMEGVQSLDLRCTGVFCPFTTVCSALADKPDSTRCVCDRGYTSTGVVTDGYKRIVETCEDIDECSLNSPCPPNALCRNLNGTFECVDTCAKVTCPGYSTCVPKDDYFYTCECSWMYISNGCTSPWPLILLILTCIFFSSTILLILYTLYTRARTRSGLYKVAGMVNKNPTHANTWF